MLSRVLEPEVMDSPEEAHDYDCMDHSAVNHRFAADFLFVCPSLAGPILDVGTGTAQIPIAICRLSPTANIMAIDLAEHMLRLGQKNVLAAGMRDRIQLQIANGRELMFPDQSFAAVISNSIIHHIPQPAVCLAEMIRVCAADGILFVRDLVRPDSQLELDRLVSLYAADANHHQRTLFTQSLHAALTLREVQDLVEQSGFPPESVQLTSDRHWTFTGRKAERRVRT